MWYGLTSNTETREIGIQPLGQKEHSTFHRATEEWELDTQEIEASPEDSRVARTHLQTDCNHITHLKGGAGAGGFCCPLLWLLLDEPMAISSSDHDTKLSKSVDFLSNLMKAVSLSVLYTVQSTQVAPGQDSKLSSQWAAMWY